MECSICLEQIQTDQANSLIQACQHRFHSACLNPWMETNSTCPNCRGPIRDEEETQELLRQRELQELDRLYLTYILFTWILQTFRGIEFRLHSNAIFAFLSQIRWNSIRPVAFQMTPRNRTSLSCLKALRVYCVSREQTLFEKLYEGQPHRVIHRNPRCLQIQQEIQHELLAFQRNLL